jgi:hypothetical protein
MSVDLEINYFLTLRFIKIATNFLHLLQVPLYWQQTCRLERTWKLLLETLQLIIISGSVANYYYLLLCSQLILSLALQPVTIISGSAASYYYLWLCSQLLFLWLCSQLLFSLALQPIAGYGLLVHEVFVITHNDAPQSVGILWASDQLVAKTSTWQQTQQSTSMPPVGSEPTIPAGERP